MVRWRSDEHLRSRLVKLFPVGSGGALAPFDLPNCSDETDLEEYIRDTMTLHTGGSENIAAHRYAAVLRKDPDNVIALSGIALLLAAKQCNVAVTFARRAVELSNGIIDGPLISLGSALLSRGRNGDFEEAIKLLAAVCHKDDSIFVAQYRLGMCYDFLGESGKAIRHYDKAISLIPDDWQAPCFRGMVLLRSGRWAEGFDALEHRWGDRRKHLISATTPEWRGEDLAGKTIALVHEQGAGDSIMFARFAKHLTKCGADVHLGVPLSLVRLFERRFGDIKVWCSDEHGYPHVHYWTPMMSAFRWLGAFEGYENLISGAPYLTAPADEKHFDIDAPSDKLRVGIAWAGTDAHHLNRFRSSTLTDFMKLALVPGVALVSLQVGERAAEIENIGANAIVYDMAPVIKDYEDTARVLSRLDLVISVDTSVVHLAGAMGVPCWMLVDYMPDWRWSRTSERSVWYDSIRVFRKRAPGSFDEVLNRVSDALRAAVGRPRKDLSNGRGNRKALANSDHLGCGRHRSRKG